MSGRGVVHHRQGRGMSTIERKVTATRPEFSHDGYAWLLQRLLALGYDLYPASMIGQVEGRAVFLRHDIDLHVAGAREMAAIEEQYAARSTWYVLWDGHYNPLHPAAYGELWALKQAGHTLGLHYDLQNISSAAQMSRQIDAFTLAFEWPASLAMHRPHHGGADIFRGYRLNPHRDGIFYVSDSRREWTEPFISQLLAGEPEQAMLSTHHEHWCGPAGTARFDHFDRHTSRTARTIVDEALADERDSWIRGR